MNDEWIDFNVPGEDIAQRFYTRIENDAAKRGLMQQIQCEIDKRRALLAEHANYEDNPEFGAF